MSKLKNKKIKDLLEKYELIGSLQQLQALSGWDLETFMPTAGAVSRGNVMSKVAVHIQKLHLDEDFVKVAEETSFEKDLNEFEVGIIRILKRTLYNYYKLPPEFIDEYTKTTNQAQVAWREAKDKNDFKIFSPFLKKIIDLSIQQAEYLEYSNHPYDALLDIYEEDLTTIDVENFFEELKPNLLNIFSYIKSSKRYSPKSHPLEKEVYERSNVEKLNNKLLEYLEYDNSRMRLDESSHPFTQGINPNDIRITTRYLGRDFGATVTATMHEFGHGLYDMNVDSELELTPIGNPQSLVIHESQSRFWENIVGRNHEFMKVFTSKYRRIGDNFKKYGTRDFFRYFNSVRPSTIRVESDEITYHFHIMIRFEIEKLMIEKGIEVNDLPELWNSKYKEYLGIKPKSDREGILQDIHWSMGAIGYFPTYSMGSILSAYWSEKITKDLGSIDFLLKSEDGIRKIKLWLKDNIHDYGASLTLRDLLEKKFKSSFRIDPWVRYINEKYSQLY